MSNASPVRPAGSVDWSARPWGRPIMMPSSEQQFLEEHILCHIDFRYHGIKIRSWKLFLFEDGHATLLPPAIEIHVGNGDAYRHSASYFLSPEEDRKFKDDVAYLLDAMPIPRWKKGTRID